MIITRCVLIWAAFALVAGCASQKSYSDPLASYHWSSLSDLENNKAISEDSKNYIQTVTPGETRGYSLNYYANGTGKHAVEIIIIEKGAITTRWKHILIYDRDNKRTKTLKYVNDMDASN